jgi:NAD(P)-dependent dehydrogenase (short-subunit alcohol dehydrogenase family)
MMKFAKYPSLEGATVFVTGGASGIGKEIVSSFASQKARIGIIDLDRDGGQALASILTADGVEVVFEHCDLRDITALERTFAALQKQLGAANVLVNNAARDDRHDWQEVTSEYFDDRIATNLKHMFFAIQSVAPGMISIGGGSIINIGSNSWWEAGGGFPVYATLKGKVASSQ